MIGTHLIKSRSSIQSVISFSSGEAEFYGVVKSSGIGLGYQALLEDLGWKVPLRVWTDSTATLGICGRSGLGKLRHIDTRALWIQQRVKDSSVELRKVKGEFNPADLFTKHLPSGQKIVDLLALLNCVSSSGRPSAAPALKTASSSIRPTAVLSIDSSNTSPPELDEYHGRLFPFVVLDDGLRVPEAFDHDTSILPHQHEDLEERFPQAFVPVAADADETTSEADALEQHGTALGRSGTSGGSSSSRSGAQEALSCTGTGAAAASWQRAMASHTTSVACVEPSSDNEDKNEKGKQQQGRLPPQNPSRAMASQATSAACVSPWHRPAARAKITVDLPGSLRGRPPQRWNLGGALEQQRERPPGRPTSVAGSYAAKIASAHGSSASPTTTAGRSSWSGLQESSGGSAGKPGCSRARRRAFTVAFELLRLLKRCVQQC